jgi:hypothetical protein
VQERFIHFEVSFYALSRLCLTLKRLFLRFMVQKHIFSTAVGTESDINYIYIYIHIHIYIYIHIHTHTHTHTHVDSGDAVDILDT